MIIKKYAAIAQLVEQGTENPCVLGSIPRRGIFLYPENFDNAEIFYWIL